MAGIRNVFILFMLVVACCYGLFMWSRSDAGPRPAPAKPTLQAITANGVTEGVGREVPMRPEIPGQIAALHYRENQEVPADAIIAELQNNIQKAQLAVAEAELKRAEAELSRATANATRAQRLMARSAGSVEEAEQRHFDKKVAETAVTSARANVALTRARLEQTYLKAPCAGRILTVDAEVGQQTGPASPKPVVVFADLSRRRVRAFVEELDAFKVKPGQDVTVTIDGLPDAEYKGKVATVLPRMGQNAVHSGRPGEYRDLYYREVIIDLDGGSDLPVSLRVRVWIDAQPKEEN